jgi:hypothetical protein
MDEATHLNVREDTILAPVIEVALGIKNNLIWAEGHLISRKQLLTLALSIRSPGGIEWRFAYTEWIESNSPNG